MVGTGREGGKEKKKEKPSGAEVKYAKRREHTADPGGIDEERRTGFALAPTPVACGTPPR